MRRSLEVSRYCGSLVRRDRVNVGEAASGWEARDGPLMVRPGVTCEDGGADGSQVWACGGEVRGEDRPVVQTAIVTAVARTTCHAGIAGGDDDGDPLKTKLHELVALTLLVRGREVCFLTAVGDGDDVRGLVHAALELPNSSITPRNTSANHELRYVALPGCLQAQYDNARTMYSDSWSVRLWSRQLKRCGRHPVAGGYKATGSLTSQYQTAFLQVEDTPLWYTPHARHNRDLDIVAIMACVRTKDSDAILYFRR
jgi:hypothetical protein